MSNPIVNSDIFTATDNVIADIVKFQNAKDALGDLKDSIKARLDDEIQRSGVPIAEALKSLRKELVTAGIDRRRVSETLIALGFKVKESPKPAKDEEGEDKETSAKEEKAAKLAPVIEALKELAKEQAGEDAISALRRAWLSLQAELKA